MHPVASASDELGPEGVIGDDAIHAIGDCYVSLTHGEGWGMGAFDAATLGKPVLITGWGSPRIGAVQLDAGGAQPSPELRAQHPGLVIARVPAGALAALPGAQAGIWLIDPLGNLVLSYPGDPDIKGLARDLSRLLQASRIG